MSAGFDLIAARAEGRDIYLDAEEMVKLFTNEGCPYEVRFFPSRSGAAWLGPRASRQVTVFGEIVAIMWERGNQGAAVRLEYLWQELCTAEAFSPPSPAARRTRSRSDARSATRSAS